MESGGPRRGEPGRFFFLLALAVFAPCAIFVLLPKIRESGAPGSFSRSATGGKGWIPEMERACSFAARSYDLHAG